MSNAPWTDEENDLIVADYFAMLKADVMPPPCLFELCESESAEGSPSPPRVWSPCGSMGPFRVP